MAIDMKFDLMNNPEPPTIVLATRSGKKLGQLDVNTESVDLSDNLTEACEFTFTLNKYVDGKLANLWDKVVDFKLVYCKEWDKWFEITVELDEATETVKTVFCTQLGQAELSQIMLYNIEINTEDDIARDDYKISILYDENDPKASILNRILDDKAPHYRIAYVDETLKRIQRSFSFDDTSICDALDEVEEEVGCLVIYNSNSDKGGMPNRTISVYDLQQNCNGCGYRGEFTDKCPKCGSTDIKYGYGEDTTIFVTADELATEGIQLVTDTDSVKNCFKLEAGDDLMTATIRNCNPNGSDYIWYFSDAVKEDMSEELVKKIEDYDKLYKDYYNNHESALDENLVGKYNNLVEKYKNYYNTPSTCLNCKHEGVFESQCPECGSENILTGKSLQTISTPITGYAALMNAYYNTIDLSLYLNSGLMPNIEMSDTNAEEQAKLLTSSSLSPVAVNVDNIQSVSLATANRAVLSMAKIIVKSTYKVEVNTSTLSNNKVWEGNFIITNYSDDEDTAVSDTISVVINNDTEAFIKQKIEKALNKENTDDYSISGLFAKDYDEFCAELKKYALNPLNSFYDACETCLSILTEQGTGNKDQKLDLYESLYQPYYNKSMAIAEEIKIREDEIAVIEGVYDETDENNKVLITEGLQANIEKCKSEIQSALNFESYIGEDLWLEFCGYRREDKYSNDNYISDGLNNAELFKKANEFIEVAENEIFKSAELQHSISATLNNFLAIPKFKPLVKYFKTGNWIRVQIDEKIYKLRLLKYDISYGDLKNIPVEFSDVTKIKNGITDVKDIIEQASSMASSYDSVQRQAQKGNVARSTIDQWIVDGLNSADVQITSNDSEEVLLTRNGLLARSYDDITGTYSPEQFKLTHNIMAYTDDNWETVSSALGKHKYKHWDGTSFVDDEDYGLTSRFVEVGQINGSQMIGGEIVSSNYQPKQSGTYINLLNGDFDFAGGKIVFDTDKDALTLNNVTIEWANTNAPEVTVNDVSGLEDYLDELDQLEIQLDGRIQTYNQTTDPSSSWAEDEKTNHIGDLWLNSNDGLTKSWNGTFWEVITDSDLKKLAQSKAQIFTTTPTLPYFVGDLWVQGSAGDILHCVNSKAENEFYSESDWVKSSKYTDDTLASEALETAKQGVQDAAEGISLAQAAQNRAENAESNAKNYADLQDTSLSTTLTSAYKTYVSSEISILDSYIAKYFGLGGSTIVGENYVISPIIEGGYLNITNTDNNSKVIIDPNNLTGNDYIFQVHNGTKMSVGVDNKGNASFNGAITATSLTLDGATVPYDKIDNKPTKLSDFENDLNIATTDYIQIESTTNETTGITTTTTTVGDKIYTTYTSDDASYLLTNIGMGSASPSEDDIANAGYTNGYFKVSKNGLLTANNAIIWGTIYATNGKFTGDIVANSLTLNSDLKIGDNENGYHTWISTDGVLNAWGANLSNINAVDGTIDNCAITDATIGDCTIIGGSLKIGNSADSYHTWISTDGVLNANGVNISGTINATDGEIASWIINPKSISKTTEEGEHANEVYTVALRSPSDGSDMILSCSADYYGEYPFYVRANGFLYAKDAHIEGEIFATSGEIGGLKIDNGIKGYVNNAESFSLTPDGLIIDNTSAKIQVGNVQIYHDSESESTYFQTDGAMRIQGLESGSVVTSIELMTDENGTTVIRPNISLKLYKTFDTLGHSVISVQAISNVELYRRYSVKFYYGTVLAYSDSITLNIYGGTKESSIQTLGTYDNATMYFSYDEVMWQQNTFFFKQEINSIVNGTTISFITTLQRKANNNIKIMGNMVPTEASQYNLGTAPIPWDDVFTTNGNVQLSDKNKKHDIADLTDNYDVVFDNLTPVSYKLNSGTSNRTHLGLIAQDVKKVILDTGLTTQDFAGYCEWENDDGTIGCGLRYGEFIALNINQIQKLKKRIEELENKINTLK